MSVELTKDLLTMEQVAGIGYEQALVEGDILVPDIKPDISRILSIEGIVDITNKEALEDRMTVDGAVNFKILYVPVEGEYPVYGMDASATFNQSIDMPETQKGMYVEAKAEIEHIDFNIINERKIGIKAVVNLSGGSRIFSEVDILRDVHGIENLQLLRESIIYQDKIESNKSELIVRESFELENDMPEIKEILKCNVDVVEKEKQVVDGKIALSGLLKANIVYVADDDDYSLQFLKYELPFTHFIEIVDVQKDMDVEITMKPNEIYTNVKENIDGEQKILDLEADVQVILELSSIEEKEIIVDAYSPNRKLTLDKKKIALDQIVGKNSSNAIIKETLELPSGHKKIGNIFDVSARPILTDNMVNDGKNNIEGIIEVNLLYMPQGEDQEARNFTQELPFRHTIELDDIKDGMEIDTDLYIDELDYNLINSDQVEIRMNIGASSTAKKRMETEVLVGMEDAGEIIDAGKGPSITVYFIQPKDTLWKIAKRYHTTVEELMNSNDIQEPNKLVVGERLFIQKNVFHKF